MKRDFGYKINKTNQIDFDKANISLYKDILKKEPSLNSCMFCGSCAGTCSTGQFTQFGFKYISLWLRRGMNDKVKECISKCMFCGKCTLVCPRNVNIRNILFHLKKHYNGNEL